MPLIGHGAGHGESSEGIFAAAGPLDQSQLAAVVFFGAGSVKGMVTDAMWDRGIVVTSAWAATAMATSRAVF